MDDGQYYRKAKEYFVVKVFDAWKNWILSLFVLHRQTYL